MGIETLAALRAGALAGALELDLSGLGLAEVPREVLGLAASLRHLDLGGNALTDLPGWLAGLGRLEVLFASRNRFERLPPVLGALPALGQIGLRGCGLREIPGEALPPRLRWLTLTDNCLETLPQALGERPHLQKLMLAGNRLRALPASLAGASRLELIRLSANQLEALSPWLATLPNLAWLAFAGNPLDRPNARPEPAPISWAALTLGPMLGQGASGRVHAAQWRHDGAERPVAVKLFKGGMTSDGLPDCEMAACLAAGTHAHLAGGLGRVEGHPESMRALVMPLLPAHWQALAGPPSLESCSRDVYAASFAPAAPVALRIAAGIAQAGAHLHGRGLLHGDLYAHNILWDGTRGEAVLSDFGAASVLPPDQAELRRLDTLAFGRLLAELVARCGAGDGVPAARSLAEACCAPVPGDRPSFAEIAASLEADAA